MGDRIVSRQLAIASQIYELLITPQGEPDATIWRFELHNLTVSAAIPGGFKLRLLNEDLQPFPNNEDIAITAVEQLYIHFRKPIACSVLYIHLYLKSYERKT